MYSRMYNRWQVCLFIKRMLAAIGLVYRESKLHWNSESQKRLYFSSNLDHGFPPSKGYINSIKIIFSSALLQIFFFTNYMIS